MFDNVNWNRILDKILAYIEKNWEKLIIKAYFSKMSFSAKYYYSKKDNEFIDLDNTVKEMEEINKTSFEELMKITQKFTGSDETMFLTMKVDKKGNLKVIYKDIKEGNRIPWDEVDKYLLSQK